ncbi:MAG: prepilin peptidase, partial [Nitrospinota bacterium]
MSVVLYFYFCAFVFGTLVGSFSNVCILRMPERRSVVFPPSHCPSCKNKIAWFDNIPVLSWFVLLGRCRRCKAFISPLYPSVEFVSGLMYIANFYFWGVTPQFFLFSFLCSSFLIIAVIDYHHK